MNEARTWTPEDRQRLVELLERFNLSVDSFDGLRADSYEHALARHSLASLELLYTELLKPGNAEARTNCPTWPPGTKRAGKLPSTGALSEIATRLRTEQTLNSLGRVSGFLDTIRNRASALPAGRQDQVLDTVMTLMGEELIQAKLTGAPVVGLLPVVDRMLTSEGMKTRARQEAQKIDLRKQAEARAVEKLKLETRKLALAEAQAKSREAVEESAAAKSGKLDAETKAEILAAIDRKLVGL